MFNFIFFFFKIKFKIFNGNLIFFFKKKNYLNFLAKNESFFNKNSLFILPNIILVLKKCFFFSFWYSFYSKFLLPFSLMFSLKLNNFYIFYFNSKNENLVSFFFFFIKKKKKYLVIVDKFIKNYILKSLIRFNLIFFKLDLNFLFLFNYIIFNMKLNFYYKKYLI